MNHYASAIALTVWCVVAVVGSISDYNWRQCFPYYNPWPPGGVNGGSGDTHRALFNCNFTAFKSGSQAVDYLCHGEGLFNLGPAQVPKDQKLRTYGVCQSSVTTLKNGTFIGANIDNIKISFNRFVLLANVKSVF